MARPKGYKHSQETKEKIRKNHSKNSHQPQCGYQKGHKTNVGRECTEETKRKIGSKNFKYGSSEYWQERARKTLEKKYSIAFKDLNLPENYVIHHISKDKTDNRFENLCVMTRPEHTKLHHEQGDIHCKTYSK